MYLWSIYPLCLFDKFVRDYCDVFLCAVIYRYMLDELLGEYDDPKEMFCCGEIIVINREDTKVSMCVYVLL